MLNQAIDAGKLKGNKTDLEYRQKRLDEEWADVKSEGIASDEDYKQYSEKWKILLDEFMSAPCERHAENGVSAFALSSRKRH